MRGGTEGAGVGTSKKMRHTAGYLALALLVTSACSSSSDGNAGPETPVDQIPEDAVGASGQSAVPFESLSDWAWYSDHVAHVTVTGERDGDSPDSNGGDSFVDRYVEVEVLDQLYSYPGSSPLPDQFEMLTQGYLVSEAGELRPIVAGGPWMDVGEDYVVALYKPGQLWDVVTPSSVFAVDGEVLVSSPSDDVAREAVSGMSVGEVSEVLEATELPEELRGHAYVAPSLRYELAGPALVDPEYGATTTTAVAP
jgi:hypothetical protein